MKAVLNVENLNAGYGGRSILNNVALSVAPQEIVAIIGNNGAGKSTILKSIFNLIPWREGTIDFLESSLLDLPPHRILKGGIAYVPQNHSVFPKLSIAENLLMGGYILKDQVVRRQRTESVLDMFPFLHERRGQLAGTLSGGEQRLLEIARTLLVDPKLIMLDEPSIGLAPKMVDQVFSIIRTLREDGKAILMVEQNVKKALEFSDRGYVLELGEVKIEDSAHNLIGDDRVARLYMGN